MTDIAIFPIPNCVTFPGTSFPLHVFEPRYRKLVKHCVEKNIPLAICHTRKVVSEAKPDQTLDQALSSNQATYKPYDIFSAGRCELREELPDGRMLAIVHLEKRYKKIAEIQTLPFSIYQCEEIPDQLEENESSELSVLKEKVLSRLLALTSSMKEVNDELSSEKWTQMPPENFSYEIFGVLKLESEMMQNILEMCSAIERLEFTLNILNEQ